MNPDSEQMMKNHDTPIIMETDMGLEGTAVTTEMDVFLLTGIIIIR